MRYYGDINTLWRNISLDPCHFDHIRGSCWTEPPQANSVQASTAWRQMPLQRTFQQLLRFVGPRWRCHAETKISRWVDGYITRWLLINSPIIYWKCVSWTWETLDSTFRGWKSGDSGDGKKVMRFMVFYRLARHATTESRFLRAMCTLLN